jgi:hypothetical protein
MQHEVMIEQGNNWAILALMDGARTGGQENQHVRWQLEGDRQDL